LSKIYILDNKGNNASNISSLGNSLVLENISQERIASWDNKINSTQLNTTVNTINSKISSINRDLQTITTSNNANANDIANLKAKLNDLMELLGEVKDTNTSNNTWLGNLAQDIGKINDFIDSGYTDEIKELQKKLDNKADSYVQEGYPHPEYKGVTENNNYNAWLGDIWRKPSTGEDFKYIKKQNDNGTFDYIWETQAGSIPDSLFDLIDGKSSIYFSKPSSYNKRDCWILESDEIHPPNKMGTLLFANKSNTSYNADDWIDLVTYVTQNDYNIYVAKVNEFINKTYTDNIKEINNKIDSKADSYFQESQPHEEYDKVSDNNKYNGWLGDIWRKPSTGADYKYIRTQYSDGTYKYFWELQTTSIPDDLFDKIDGKASIYFTKPTNYNAHDCWVLESDTVHPPQKKGTLLFAKNSNSTYVASDWIDLLSYVTQSQYEELQNNLNNFINETYNDEVKNINSKIDNKADSYVQEDKPHREYTDVSQSSTYDGWIGDIWRKISTGEDFKYVRVQGTASNTYTYRWEAQSMAIPDSLYDKIDGKATIYFARPDSYAIRDCWILENDTIHPPQKKGTMLFANKTNTSYNASDWIDLLTYITQEKYQELIDKVDDFIDTTYTEEIKNINSKIDNKADSYVQSTKPHNEYTNVSQNSTYDGWVGDIWRNSITGEDFKYVRIQGTSSSVYTYRWESQSATIPDALYDKIDGKASIYFTKPSTYNAHDCWILENNTVHTPNKQGTLLFANKTNTTYNASDWVDLLEYLTESEVDDKVKNVTTKYEELSDRFSWLVSSSSTETSLVITDKLIQAIANSEIQLSAKKILINGLLEGAGWRVDEEGNFVVNDLNIIGTLTCKNFSTENLVGSTIGKILDSDKEFNANTSLLPSMILDNLPYNLNGYSVKIYMDSDLTDNITFSKHINGSIELYLCGHTLTGFIHTMFDNSIYKFYGGNNDSDTTNIGKIMPYGGYVLGSYAYTMLFSNSPNVVVENIAIYGCKSTTNTVGLGATQKTNLIMKNVKFIGCKHNCRTYSLSKVHCDSSSGLATSIGWYAGTGSVITLATTNQAGGNPNTNTGNNGQIYSTGATFSGNAESGSNTSTGETETERSVTYYPTYSDTYRTSLYNNWAQDGVARQGKYTNPTSAQSDGYFFFGTQFNEVKGKKIIKVDITLSRKSGVGASASCSHGIYYHTYTGRTTGKPSLTSCNSSISLGWGDTDTVSITTSSVLNGIKNGTIKGFAIKSTYDLAHYSAISNCKIKIYYVDGTNTLSASLVNKVGEAIVGETQIEDNISVVSSNTDFIVQSVSTYNPTTWQNGDLITSTKLNNLEQGLADCSSFCNEETINQYILEQLNTLWGGEY